MASRIAEVVYKLRDLFTRPAEKIEGQYRDMRQQSRKTADQIDRDTDRMGGTFKRLGAAAKAGIAGFVAAFSGREVAQAINTTADELDRLGKSARLVNIDPNTFAALEFALDRSGVAAGKLEGILVTLQKRTGEAVQGFGAAARAFNQLGIEAEEFQKLDAEGQLLELSDALSAVADEEQRAAAMAGLFSKANVDLFKALGGGSAALRKLIADGKEFRTVTEDQVRAAEAYNDALTNLGTSIEGQKFRVLGPVLEYINQQLELTGAGADELSNLTTQLEQAQKEFDALNKFAVKGSAEWNRLAQRTLVLRQRIEELTDAQEAEEKAARESANVRQQQIEENARFEASLESLTQTFEDKAKAQEASLKKETADLKAARAEQTKVEAEFQNLVTAVTSPVDDDVGLIDVFQKINEAARALEDDQAELAINLARQGGGFLENLAKQGDESSAQLGFLARRLQAIARAAAQERVDVELVDEEKAAAALDGVKNKLEALSSDAAKAGTAAGKAFVDALQVELDAANPELPQLSARLEQRLATLPEGVAATIPNVQNSLEKSGAK